MTHINTLFSLYCLLLLLILCSQAKNDPAPPSKNTAAKKAEGKTPGSAEKKTDKAAVEKKEGENLGGAFSLHFFLESQMGRFFVLNLRVKIKSFMQDHFLINHNNSNTFACKTWH